jgi:hypothetical protein
VAFAEAQARHHMKVHHDDKVKTDIEEYEQHKLKKHIQKKHEGQS